ncbi:MAG TPA: hypothetical protein VEW92_09390 [Nitrososphaeraceae archaeon]|nr:hypothetical protein [Nitrososphaeraceae archaeon]
MSKLSDIVQFSINDIKLLLLALIISSIISSILVYLLTSTYNHELRFMFSNWVIDISAGLAFIFSLLLILRERKRKSEGKKYVSLFIAISLWFSAEIVYTYYQSISRIDVPYPSYADSLWLLGYIFMAYHLYSSFYYWNKKKKFSESSVFIITIFSALLILFLVQSSAITYSNDINLILIAILYHIADAIILIPALVLLWNLRHEKLLYFHRALISLFVILNTFANVGYIFTFNSGINIIIEYAWIWDLLYNLSYILLAGALFWYDKLIQVLNKKIDQSIILNTKQFQFLLEKQNKAEIIRNNSYSYIDKENIKDTINTLITNAKTEISLLTFIHKKHSHNLIMNLNSLLTDSNMSNTLKIRILFNNIFNLKLLLSTNPANLNIQYVKIGKIFRSDMIIFIIDNQHLLFIDLKQDIDPNNFLATYSANSNIILQFSSFFENLSNLSELREQSPKI